MEKRASKWNPEGYSLAQMKEIIRVHTQNEYVDRKIDDNQYNAEMTLLHEGYNPYIVYCDMFNILSWNPKEIIKNL